MDEHLSDQKQWVEQTRFKVTGDDPEVWGGVKDSDLQAVDRTYTFDCPRYSFKVTVKGRWNPALSQFETGWGGQINHFAQVLRPCQKALDQWAVEGAREGTVVLPVTWEFATMNLSDQSEVAAKRVALHAECLLLFLGWWDGVKLTRHKFDRKGVKALPVKQVRELLGGAT